jgi:hypothetical protein
MTRFNIIGFSNASGPWHSKKTCPLHHAVLIPKRNDSTGEYETGMLRCPLCGSTYSDGPVNRAKAKVYSTSKEQT